MNGRSSTWFVTQRGVKKQEEEILLAQIIESLFFGVLNSKLQFSVRSSARNLIKVSKNCD